MSTLDRYIARSFYRGFFLVALVLMTLFSFAAFVQELDDVGKGDYRMVDAALYVVLTLPRRFFEIAPISGMLGALFSLSSLAAESELIAMRSIGASVKGIAASSLKAAIPALLLLLVIAQWLGPKYEREARNLRATAIAKGQALETNDGFWLREQEQFIRIGSLLGGSRPSDLIIFEFDANSRLHRYLTADEAEYAKSGMWILKNAQVTTFTDFGSDHDSHAALTWQSNLGQEELNRVPLAPETMAPTDLIAEIRNRRARGLATENHTLALWYTLSRPLSFLAMLLFAVPFVFSTLRDSSQGRRTVQGAIIGILAYFIDQISGFAGLIFQVHPALTALGPSVVVAILAMILLIKSE
ncbi:MAG: lipopolysaccharide export system permease protein [Planctomycetota bacterium]|jgi:lipopolysaccharide export system permease protein